jgi:hypothetical protein
MRQSIRLAALLLAAATLACTVSIPSLTSISGSGEIITITKDFADFDQVEIGSALDATVQQGDTFEVVSRNHDARALRD